MFGYLWPKEKPEIRRRVLLAMGILILAKVRISLDKHITRTQCTPPLSSVNIANLNYVQNGGRPTKKFGGTENCIYLKVPLLLYYFVLCLLSTKNF